MADPDGGLIPGYMVSLISHSCSFPAPALTAQPVPKRWNRARLNCIRGATAQELGAFFQMIYRRIHKHPECMSTSFHAGNPTARKVLRNNPLAFSMSREGRSRYAPLPKGLSKEASAGQPSQTPPPPEAFFLLWLFSK